MAQDAPFYRAQAAKAREEADTAVLDNVRERALRSVAAFEMMAASAERVTKQREDRKVAANPAPQ